MDPRFRIKLLGGLGFVLDGHSPPELRRPGLQLLLASLLLSRHAPLSREQLAARLWPEEISERARATLRVALLRLRRALPDPETWLEVGPERVAWRDESPFALDVADLEALFTGPETPESLERALRLYTGELLPGRLEDWVVAERVRLEQAFQAFMRRGLDGLERQGDLSAALRLGEALLVLDPLSEEASERLMRLQAKAGQRQAALTTYDRHRAALRRELGVAPSEGLKALRRSMLQEGSSDPGPRTPERPCVGREAEQRTLAQLQQEAYAQGARLVILEGEAGVGKTHLAQWLLARASQQGNPLACRCFEVESQLAFGPVLSLLRQLDLKGLSGADRRVLSSLLPELSEGGARGESPSISGPWQWERLLETAARALLDLCPVALLIDDLQWCDEESLAFFALLVRKAQERPLLVVATLRSEGLTSSHRSWRWLTGLGLEVPLVLRSLPRFGAVETAQLLEVLEGQPVSKARVQAVLEGTLGNPLSIVSLIQEELATGQPVSDVHASFRRLMVNRLTRLSLAARELVGLVAAFGSELPGWLMEGICRLDVQACTYKPTSGASGSLEIPPRYLPCGERMCWLVQELTDAGILERRESGQLGFTHALIQEVATTRLRGPQRRRLCLQLARVQVTLAQEGQPVEASRIARAFELAGASLEAARWYLLAAGQDLRLRAVEAATHHYSLALRLAEDRSEGMVWAALVGRLRCHRIASRSEALLQDLARIEALATDSRNPAWLAEAAVFRGRQVLQTLDTAGAERAAREALERIPMHAEGSILLASALWLGSWNAREVLKELGSLLDLAGHHPDSDTAIRALHWTALLGAQAGREREALAAADRCLELARASEDPIKLAEAQGLRSVVLRTFRRLSEARENIEEAMARVSSQTVWPGEIHPLLEYGVILLYLRRLGRARVALERGLRAVGSPVLIITATGLKLAQAQRYALVGKLEPALRLLEECLSHFHVVAGKLDLRCFRSRLLLAVGQVEEAWLEVTRAEALPRLVALTSKVSCTKGLVLEAMGQVDAAETAFRETMASLEQATEMNRAELRLDAGVGLARLARGRGAWESALGWLEPLLCMIDANDEGLLEPQQVYLELARVLRGSGRIQEARAALDRARRLVLETARHLDLAEERRGFLEDVPANREILEAWREEEGGGVMLSEVE